MFVLISTSDLDLTDMCPQLLKLSSKTATPCCNHLITAELEEMSGFIHILLRLLYCGEVRYKIYIYMSICIDG